MCVKLLSHTAQKNQFKYISYIYYYVARCKRVSRCAYRSSIKKQPKQKKTSKWTEKRNKKNCQAIYCNQSLMDRQKNSFSCSFQIISYHNCGYTLYIHAWFVCCSICIMYIYVVEYLYSMCWCLFSMEFFFWVQFSRSRGLIQNGEKKYQRAKNKRIHNDFLYVTISRGKTSERTRNQTKSSNMKFVFHI